jgi:TolB-like protein
MNEKATTPMRIDLTQFKLHIELPQSPGLTLQFTSPSRRFYLAVIALVIMEMKRLGRVTSIPLEEHLEALALLNETVGGAGGSSEIEHLLPRIYRKWKDALPDLEDAPLFKVVGRKRDPGEGYAQGYQFTEEQKDAWANLFDYRGSEEHVRLRFSIDTLDIDLDAALITYGEERTLTNETAWEAFIADLQKEKKKETQETLTPPEQEKRPKRKLRPTRRWWPALALIIAAVAALAAWQFYLRAPHLKVAPEEMAFPLPEKPSIAVLPFTNMSGDPDQEYLSDGITEQIITGLSKVPKLFVIARHSTFTYKGKAAKVQQVSRDLGIRYVLEGSVHRSGERIRITAQLIDAITGHHLWAEKYDRDLKDVFALQDEITMEILRALEVMLTEGIQARIYRRGTNNIEAYLKTLKGIAYFERFNKDDNATARRLAEEVIALEPAYGRAYRLLSYTHMMEPFYGTGTSPKKSMEQALKLARKAVSLDDSHPCGYELLSYIYAMTRQHEKAITEAERAVSLDPNGADSRVALGYALQMAGRLDEAIESIKRGIRSNPIAPGHYFTKLGNAYRLAGHYEEAITAFKKALERSPNDIVAHYGLTAAYSLSGHEAEAKAQAKEVLRVQPNFSLNNYVKKLPYKDPSEKQLLIDALHKAGLK